MKKNKKDNDDGYVAEPGEKALDLLIKEAGEEARKRKKKAMDNHYQRLHAAIYDHKPPCNPVE